MPKTWKMASRPLFREHGGPSEMAPQDPRPDLVEVAAPMPVEQYLRICLASRRIGCDPARLVGLLIEQAAADLMEEV
jgi:hypothetical protein